MRSYFMAGLVMAICGGASAQVVVDPVGDWQGTLKAGGAELRLVLHIMRTDGGVLKATLDSIDQPGANGIPVTSISVKGLALDLAADSIDGSYRGKFSADGGAVAGTWMQGQPIPLGFKRIVPGAVKPSDIDGAWVGSLDTGTIKLRLVFHIANSDDGLTATMDSPDQNVHGISVDRVSRTGDSLTVELKKIGGKFEGKISADRKSIDGTWTQGGSGLPLVLTLSKGAAEAQRRRPQNPVAPFPYRTEDVEYENPSAKIKLAATLTIPKGPGPFPAVVLITGSGPQDRDEALMGHKPFLVLSDYLTRRGIEVLRTDDRGVAKSGGTFATATTADFATDTEAGVAFLQTRGEVNPREIGLVGHSEGGVIGPMVAARNPSIAFVVMMAGTGVPGDELIAAQSLLIAEAGGESHESAAKNAADERALLALVKQEKDDDVLRRKLRALLAGKVPDAQMDMQVKQAMSPWFRYFIAYDPAPALRKVKCPVLAINGEKDLQVPPKQNLPAIRKALEEGGNRNIEVEELPGLNHLFQTATTGSPSEYAEIEQTISPLALDKIASWILKQSAAPAAPRE